MSKSRRNGEGSIRKRGDNRWEVRISGAIDFNTGKPVRISRYANSEKEAVDLLNQLRFQYGTNQAKVNRMTLGAWLDLWLQVYMQSKLKQSTYNSYDSYAKNHFKPALGSVYLDELTPRMLQQFYNYKWEQEGLSPKTIRNLNLYLHNALSQAEREGLISSNPATGVSLPQARRPQVEILTRDNQAKLIQASYRHRYGVFIRLVLMTGLRMGELLGLRWEDVDRRSNMLYVRRTLNRLQKKNLPEGYSGARTEIVIQEPKTENSIRSIPLIPQLIRDLNAWQGVQMADKAAAGPAYQDSGMIVTNELGGYIEPRTFKKYYEQILTIANLPHYTFHALRHTFASRAMEQGMDSKTLSTLLGHASVSFTLDTYAHVLNEQKWEGIKLMEDLYALNQQTSTLIYPAVVTSAPEGYWFTLPDFPEVQYLSPSVEVGVETARQTLVDAVRVMPFPPPATPVSEIPLLPNQFVLQVIPT